ncbi:MAG: P-loop containing nucleoside triphosphate hydrolase protein [Olpidium bornovanus]|uniref:Replication factor C subunit 1 n=1 Tax=Olpidium bornovanus TaxID=278681 RepID=A0A8H7ZMP5_9FUNG|nr:MAG: P-loop containing nucleoside triphosphate hydrolase protein [Olpidium bornovanus]
MYCGVNAEFALLCRAADSLVCRRVVSAPSGKTDYVVVGRDAGPKKLEKIKQLKLKTLDEDGLLDLIRKSPAKTAESSSLQKLPKGKGKRASEPELPNEPPPTPSDASSLASYVSNTRWQQKAGAQRSPLFYITDRMFVVFKCRTFPQLWTDRYKPRSYKDLIGNHSNVASLAAWLKNWAANRRAGFGKSPRAVLISGPPGIGKTTAAHLVCDLEGFSVLEFNASDVRSKKGLEVSCGPSDSFQRFRVYSNVRIAHRSKTCSVTSCRVLYMSYCHGALQEKEGGEGKPQVIIMDEVDGMSAGDRGGMGELISIIKKTQVTFIANNLVFLENVARGLPNGGGKVPIICICNDRSSPKVKSLANYCLDLKFRSFQVCRWRSFLTAGRGDYSLFLRIPTRENLQIKPNAIDQLVQSTQSDVRQILNLLSAYRLVDSSLDYDQSKALSRASEKNSALNPFQMAEHILNGSHYRSKSLSDKLNVYFDDFSIAPLMVQVGYGRLCPAGHLRKLNSFIPANANAHNHAKHQENYIHMRPARVDTSLAPKFQMLQHLELLANAAESISDGDLVDRLIHGDQHWSLMPIHSAFSCVRPAGFVHGSFVKPGAFGPGFPRMASNLLLTPLFQLAWSELEDHEGLPRIAGTANPSAPQNLGRPPRGQAGVHASPYPEADGPSLEKRARRYPGGYRIDGSLLHLARRLGSRHRPRDRPPFRRQGAQRHPSSGKNRVYQDGTHPVAVPTVLKTAAKKRVGASTADLGGDLPDMEEAMDVDVAPDVDGGEGENGENEDKDNNGNLGEDVLIRAKKKPAGKAAGASSNKKGKSAAVSSQRRGGRK